VLMERMLALPVHELEEPAVASAGGRVPALAASVTLLRPETEEAAPPVTPTRERMPPIVGWRPSELASIEVASAPPSAGALPATVLPKLGALLEAIPASAPAPWSWWLRPLLACNELFDRGTEILGHRGHWLRESGGRIVVGYTGVALLILTLGCVLKDWLGWTW
jgi:hypothetical protein